jgi:hypothetical protein
LTPFIRATANLGSHFIPSLDGGLAFIGIIRFEPYLNRYTIGAKRIVAFDALPRKS